MKNLCLLCSNTSGNLIFGRLAGPREPLLIRRHGPPEEERERHVFQGSFGCGVF